MPIISVSQCKNTVLRSAILAHIRTNQKVTGEQFKKSQVILAYYRLEEGNVDNVSKESGIQGNYSKLVRLEMQRH